MENIQLEMKHITKLFPGVKALDNVSLQVEKGTIHSLVGENGAGKSTLMNILSGVYPVSSYEGEVYFDGSLCEFKNIGDSEKKGIVIIHQELALIPDLSVMENIFLGNEQAVNGVINWNRTRSEAIRLMNIVGLDESPDSLIRNIGVGKQQLVEIAKALSKDVSLLILDEPTAALNDGDSEKLLNLILDLKSKHGMTAIIISHKLNEVEKVSDKITIIRDGATIETLDAHTMEISEDRIIRGMVGRDITNIYPDRESHIGDVSFEVKNWTVYSESSAGNKKIDNVSFMVRKGEVVGIAGLMGSGRTELAMSIFGRSYGRGISGELYKNAKLITIRHVRDAIEHGIAYVPEDRKEQGLILIDNIYHNISLPSLNKLSPKGIINQAEEVNVGQEYLEKLNIKAPSIYQNTVNLSGGNQQKVMLARWIYADPDILILDEPTRGIDVGAKYEIYTIINELASKGKSVVIISSELPEVLGMSDRVYVMNEGKVVGELSGENTTQESVMECIMRSQ